MARLGRGYRRPIFTRNTPPKIAKHDASISGGGGVATEGRKHALSVAAISGGGSITTTAGHVFRTAAPISGGGSIVTTGRKRARSGASISGGGSITTSSISTQDCTPDKTFAYRPTPSIEAFREAQRHKRRLLGEDITFYWPEEFSWPPGTVLDPDSGMPYDPVVTASAVTQASAVVRAGLAFRAINRAGIGGETGAEAPGFLDRTHVMLILNSGCARVVEGATSFDARGSHFEIRAEKFDGVTEIDRFLVYGARKEPVA